MMESQVGDVATRDKTQMTDTKKKKINLKVLNLQTLTVSLLCTRYTWQMCGGLC